MYVFHLSLNLRFYPTADASILSLLSSSGSVVVVFANSCEASTYISGAFLDPDAFDSLPLLFVVID